MLRKIINYINSTVSFHPNNGQKVKGNLNGIGQKLHMENQSYG